MVELIAKSACGDLLPLSHGEARLSEVPWRAITGLAPYRGRSEALSDALSSAYGVRWPEPGQVEASGPVRLVWTGRAQAFLMGADPQPELGQHAAIWDLSDGWVSLRLEGGAARRVLSRLCPVDLRKERFGPGRTARTLCQHMTVSLSCLDTDAFEILAFRSMAGTLVHDLEAAMRGVAAREGLP